jgi:hypothetical protein
MKSKITVSLAAATLAGLVSVSCSGAEESHAQSAPAAAPAAEAPALPPEVSEVPSQEQADQDAEKTIDEKNADTEMEKIEKELESSTPGGG